MAKIARSLLLILACLGLATGDAFAQTDRRVALVIANAKYDHASRLTNPLADAELIATTLKAVNFASVVLVRNGNRDTIRAALADFKQRAEQADVALIYYAGHGVEVDKTNYLIPVDAQLRYSNDAAREAIPLEILTQAVQGAKRLNVIILDACRDNPLATQMITSKGASRSMEAGLAAPSPVGESLVVYSAKAGQMAMDGTGANSPFALALARRMTDRGTEIGLMFRRMRDDVITETGGKQEPFTYGSISGREYFFLPPNESPAGRRQASVEGELWDLCKTATSRAPCGEYLTRFSHGAYADLAKMRLRELDAPAASVAVAAASPANAPPVEPVVDRGTLSSVPANGYATPPPSTTAGIGRMPSINVGVIGSAQDCRVYLAGATRSTTYADARAIANTSSSVTWLYKDCLTHFAGVRRSVQAALASTGPARPGAGALTLSGQLSKPSSDAEHVGAAGFDMASQGTSVTAVVSLRNAAGQTVFGTSITKRIETGDAYRSDSMTSGGRTADEGAFAALEQQFSMAIARKISFHFAPPLVTIADGNKIRLSVGAPLLEPGMFVDVAGSNGLTVIRYQIDSADDGGAIANKVGDGDPRLVRAGSQATVVEPGSAAERRNVLERVELP